MPIDTSIYNNIQQPDPNKSLATISSIIGLKQQQQALQTGQYLQNTAQAESQQAQQKNMELTRVGNLVKNAYSSGAYKDADGNFDNSKFANDVAQVAPTYGQQIANEATARAGEIYQNQQTLTNLKTSQREQIGNTLAALAANPNVTHSDVIDAIEAMRDQYKGVPGMSRMLTSFGMSIPVNATSGQLQQSLRTVGMSLNAPATAQTNPQVSTMQSPGGLQPIQTNPQAPGGIKPIGQPFQQGVAPGIVTSPTTGGLYQTNPAGNVKPLTPQNGQPFNPSYQGQAEDVKNFQSEVNAIRQAGDQAPLAANINQQILRLSKDAKTGPGTDIWQHAIGAVGAPFGLSPSASYQEVGKFLEKNAIANMQAMGGPPSDSRLDAAAKANGSTTFSPEALQAVTKFNDATTTALSQYRQGIDHAIGMGGNANYLNLPKFKAEWAKNFDVNVFRVENAIRDGDTAELAKIKNELGSEGLKKLAAKRQALTALSNGGQ